MNHELNPYQTMPATQYCATVSSLKSDCYLTLSIVAHGAGGLVLLIWALNHFGSTSNPANNKANHTAVSPTDKIQGDIRD